MNNLISLGVLAIAASCCAAQDLTVRLVDQGTNQPVKNAMVRLHYGCTHSMRPIELTQRTDASGKAVFRAVSLSRYEFCIFPDYAFRARENSILFVPAANAGQYSRYLDKVFTTLPAEITFHVRKLTVGERVRDFLDAVFKS